MMSINTVALERALKNTLDTHDLISNIRKEERRIHGTDGN